jgi:UDP-N-acetylglucosamine diphosphorylase/glucosamine-1-phosphate N-acetyltransferase
MNYILFDDYSRFNLLPFTYTKPVCELRTGILTIREKWEYDLKASISFSTQTYLSAKFPLKTGSDNTFINGKISPTAELVSLIKSLSINEGIRKGNDLLAWRTDNAGSFNAEALLTQAREVEAEYISMKDAWNFFSKNEAAIKQDFERLTKGRTSQPLSKTNTVIGDATLVFLEEGAVVEAGIINTKSGPVYIGRDAEVMEGSVIRGPFSLGEHAALKLGTKIYGPTTVGPHCKVGGEVNNSVVMGYSNKGHDGFLGNSVIGEWCNLGADSNNSNLKNNYGNVKLYNYKKNQMVDTGLQFCGLMMGDHSKCGINTMFNTGTVVGVGANIFGGGFPPTHIPSFSWGGAEGMEEYKLDKMLETANRVYARRNTTVSEEEAQILRTVFKDTEKYRKEF